MVGASQVSRHADPTENAWQHAFSWKACSCTDGKTDEPGAVDSVSLVSRFEKSHAGSRCKFRKRR